MFDKIVYEQKYEEPCPLSKNFMNGVKRSSSTYLVRVDCGDIINNFDQALTILRSSSCRAVYPLYEMLYDGRVILVDKPQGAGIVYDREAFMSVGGYDTQLDYQADLDFYIRFTSKYSMFMYLEPYVWRVDKYSRSLNRGLMLSERKKILDRYQYEDDEVHHFGSYAYIDNEEQERYGRY